MTAYGAIPIRNYPFVRLLLPLIAGIVFQWYFKITLTTIVVSSLVAFTFFGFYFLLPLTKRFLFQYILGGSIMLLFFCVGMILTWRQNIHNDSNWYGNIYKDGDQIVATLLEPLVEKPNSYKAVVTVNAIKKSGEWVDTKGDVLIYFKKDIKLPDLDYGSQIVFDKTLQKIRNSGNPGAFDYERYCLFQDITNQVFISTEEYKILPSTETNFFQKLLFKIRDWALHTLQQNIHAPKELGIAEALLIGYRNDLDKDLVQAYSNTGVVHIIAISGLHIGVIYGVLISFFSLFKRSKFKRFFEPVLILFIIWMFTLLAGAAPSVLRASVMFTCIIAAKFLNRDSNIYNTLAASAFILLAFNPFYLWDVGFQLSYAAVFSIVLFFKSINGLLYFKNKFVRLIWGLCAVSLSAQIFALPLVIYHFHQLPLLFLFSNLLVVPLSSLVLFGELLLFLFSIWKVAASFIGMITETLIRWMNNFIEHLDKLSFSVWEGLHISIVQLVLMFACITFLSVFIFTKSKKYFSGSLICLLIFFLAQDIYLFHTNHQQKLIVYNVPKYNAADIIIGNKCWFIGDSDILQNQSSKNFNLKPSLIKFGCYNNNDIMLPDIKDIVLKIDSSNILFLDNVMFIAKPKQKMHVTALIISKNVKQSPLELNNYFDCDYIVANSTFPQWKIEKWKKECEQLHLRFHSVTEDGAFILNL